MFASWWYGLVWPPTTTRLKASDFCHFGTTESSVRLAASGPLGSPLNSIDLTSFTTTVVFFCRQSTTESLVLKPRSPNPFATSGSRRNSAPNSEAKGEQFADIATLYSGTGFTPRPLPPCPCVTQNPKKKLMTFSAGLKPFCTWKGGQGLFFSFSGMIRLL